jgi:hypothetical protein
MVIEVSVLVPHEVSILVPMETKVASFEKLV